MLGAPTTRQNASVPHFSQKLPDLIAQWVPPRHEWDFRSVTPKQCRLACLWEYARSVKAVTSDPRGWVLGKGGKKGKGANTILGDYLICEGGLLEPWVMIHDLNRYLLSTGDLKDPASFASKLKKSENPISKFLWHNLTPQTRQNLKLSLSKGEVDQKVLATLVDDFNRIICGKCIYTESRFSGVNLESATISLLERKLKESDDEKRLNRMLLEDAFPMEIVRGRPWQPGFWKRFDVWFGCAIQIRSMTEVKSKIKTELASGGDMTKVLDRHLSDVEYVLFADFMYGGTTKILAGLESWVRKEVKNFPDRPRGRAVLPPYDCLKWLSAYRLEKARRGAGIKLEKVQAMLREEDRNHPESAPTLPIYASPGAWSKAVRDADRLLKKLESAPADFEWKILFGE
jgi:hypothetical protein